MIYESWPWKREIARIAESLRRRKNQKRWRAKSAVNVEREIFICAYIIRKLMDAYKISDEVEAFTLNAKVHPHYGEPVDILNKDKILELYNLSESKRTTVGVRQFCNLVIHSYVFAPVQGESLGLDGFCIASDRHKNQRLFFFDIDSILDLLTRVAKDDICTLRIERKAIGAPCKVTLKSSEVNIPNE